MCNNIRIRNCNNIIDGTISIKDNELNIKYGINGTGKSTIAKAIVLHSKGEDVDSELRSFGSEDVSSVECDSSYSNIAIFNEEYIKNIVFDRNQVIKDSFNVFIKSENYEKKLQKINDRLRKLRVNLIGDPKVIELMKTLNDVASKLTLTQKDELAKKAFYKSVVTDKNLYNVPDELNKFTTFIKENPKNIEWIDWKTKGHAYDELCGCPFCAEPLPETYEEEKKVFSSTYKKATANNLKLMLTYFENLSEYIEESKYLYLIRCIKEVEDSLEIDLAFKGFAQELHFLNTKLTNINKFDTYTIRQSDISALEKTVKDLLISADVLDVFTNRKTIELIDSINDKINEIVEAIGQVKSEVGELKGLVNATVDKYKKDINSFLKTAGIKYKIDIEVNGESEAITTLSYIGNAGETEVVHISKRLSWGEKNAFALVLFMFHALSQKADLIILDDPISSFDNHKKYAIISRLFSNSGSSDSLYNKTVLMLTHDFEPVIDFVINKKPTGGFVNAHFIRNHEGTLNEKRIIYGEGVKSCIALYTKYAKDPDLDNVSRLVFLRQLIEHTNISDYEDGAYNIISSLIHGYSEPKLKVDSNTYVKLDGDKLIFGLEYLRGFLDDFEYNTYLENYFNTQYLLELYQISTSSYLKLQIFRVYIDMEGYRGSFDDDILLKFIDEIYHIENDYIYYLDVFEYDLVPTYIASKCNGFFEELVPDGATI